MALDVGIADDFFSYVEGFSWEGLLAVGWWVGGVWAVEKGGIGNEGLDSGVGVERKFEEVLLWEITVG